jgi:universal stress protein A
MAYRRILLAADFSEHGERALQRARELAADNGAELHVVHVVEFIPPVDSSFGPIVPYDADLSEQLMDSARASLGTLRERLGLPPERCRIEIGSPKSEIVRVASELQADLIVVGSHGRHGFGLLLGSTASSVVHHAECDVLAVRLPA